MTRSSRDVLVFALSVLPTLSSFRAGACSIAAISLEKDSCRNHGSYLPLQH